MSTDGSNWTILTNPGEAAERVMCIAIDSADNLYVATEGRICKSAAGGTSWSQLSAFPASGSAESLAVSADDSKVWVCHDSTLYRYSASGGLSSAYGPGADVDLRSSGIETVCVRRT